MTLTLTNNKNNDINCNIKIVIYVCSHIHRHRRPYHEGGMKELKKEKIDCRRRRLKKGWGGGSCWPRGRERVTDRRERRGRGRYRKEGFETNSRTKSNSNFKTHFPIRCSGYSLCVDCQRKRQNGMRRKLFRDLSGRVQEQDLYITGNISMREKESKRERERERDESLPVEGERDWSATSRRRGRVKEIDR